MRRRTATLIAIAALSAGLAPGRRGARAQTAPRTARVGLLSATSAEIFEALFAAMREALAARGWVEGRNLAFDAAYADGRLDRLPELAQALVARRPDVIVGHTAAATQALAAATATLPIVGTAINDPIANGLTDSLARPSRNVTGFTNFQTELAGKRLDLLLAVAPKAKRIGLLHADDPDGARLTAETDTAARARGVALVNLRVDATERVPAILAAAMADPLDALIVGASPVTYPAMPEIVEFAAARRLPAIYALRQMAVDGGLMALAYDPFDNVRGAGDYAARVLAGAPIASLPFQQPSRVPLTVNLTAARRAGIEFPAGVLAIADEVIE